MEFTVIINRDYMKLTAEKGNGHDFEYYSVGITDDEYRISRLNKDSREVITSEDKDSFNFAIEVLTAIKKETKDALLRKLLVEAASRIDKVNERRN